MKERIKNKVKFKLYVKHLTVKYKTKNTESKNPKVVRTKNGRIMILSKCEVCNSTKPIFLKEEEAKGLLSSLTALRYF